MSDEHPMAGRAPFPERRGAEIPPSATYRLTLPEFEGPLDLLLHLCQTHELDILNIPIAFVAEKYCEYLDMMEGMAVEVAAEYLVMAAHLVYLKSRELVPSPEPLETADEEEEALDPREELIRRLLEYQKYKDAAAQLAIGPSKAARCSPAASRWRAAARPALPSTRSGSSLSSGRRSCPRPRPNTPTMW